MHSITASIAAALLSASTIALAPQVPASAGEPAAGPTQTSAAPQRDATPPVVPARKQVLCGSDSHGDIYTTLPSSWKPIVRSSTLCRWLSPDATATITLRVKAPRVGHDRAAAARHAEDYVEHAYLRVRVPPWGSWARLWDYSATRDDTRRRHRVIGALGPRLAYSAKVGSYTEYRHVFARARRESGLAG